MAKRPANGRPQLHDSLLARLAVGPRQRSRLGRSWDGGTAPMTFVIASPNASGSAKSRAGLPGTVISPGSARAARRDSSEAYGMTVSQPTHQAI
jgi:hypothetical protein